MKLTVLLFGFFLYTQVVDSQVIGYVGKSITLASGADPSWTLEKIEWAIYSNNTWIATFRDGTLKTDRVARYKKRLSLNKSSGDLTIHDLSLNDAMEYSVDLTNKDGANKVNKIRLEVKQPLEKPNITLLHRLMGRSCVIMLSCQSSVRDTTLSWDTTSFSGTNRTIDTSDGLLLIIYTTQKYNDLTCTSRRDKDNASSAFQAICDDENTVSTVKPTNPPAPPTTTPCWRQRMGLHFFGGFVLGAVLTLLVIYIIGQLQSPGKCPEGPWRSSAPSL